jgi:hypothetical protein
MNYQVGTCGDTLKTNNLAALPTSFALKVCKGLRLKHTLLLSSYIKKRKDEGAANGSINRELTLYAEHSQ